MESTVFTMISILNILIVEYFVKRQFVAASATSVSNENAVKDCSKTGRTLLNYKQIEDNPTAPEYLNQLRNVESAWIEGYATLSPFLIWQGCYIGKNLKTKADITGRVMRNRNVYSCWEECDRLKNFKPMFIGIKNISCYCIDQNQRGRLQNLSVNYSFCSIKCSNYMIDSCGGSSYMSLYSIVEKERIHWAANEPSPNLCVYVKKSPNSSSKFDAYTASCHSLRISGYICTYSAWSGWTKTNCPSQDTFQDHRIYCIIEGPTTRQRAHDECLSKNGSLAELGAENNVSHRISPNYSYWLGIYRTFHISDTNKTSKTVCLSVTKDDRSLYLEPDDCAVQKHYLCNSNSGINEEFPVHYIIPSILVFICIFIIIIVLVAYRRHIRDRKRTQIVPDHYDSICEADSMQHEQPVSSDPDLNVDSKCLGKKSKPHKPERRTLKQRQQRNEYENQSPKSDGKENEKKQNKARFEEADKYDKICFHTNVDSYKDVFETKNVYGLMSQTKDDYYDTMKSKDSTRFLDRVDESYIHTEKGSTINDYSVLGKPTNKLSSKVTVDNTTYTLISKETDVAGEEEKL